MRDLTRFIPPSAHHRADVRTFAAQMRKSVRLAISSMSRWSNKTRTAHLHTANGTTDGRPSSRLRRVATCECAIVIGGDVGGAGSKQHDDAARRWWRRRHADQLRLAAARRSTADAAGRREVHQMGRGKYTTTNHQKMHFVLKWPLVMLPWQHHR